MLGNVTHDLGKRFDLFGIRHGHQGVVLVHDPAKVRIRGISTAWKY